MIKVEDNSKVTFDGDITEIMMDISLILNSMYHSLKQTENEEIAQYFKHYFTDCIEEIFETKSEMEIINLKEHKKAQEKIAYDKVMNIIRKAQKERKEEM